MVSFFVITYPFLLYVQLFKLQSFFYNLPREKKTSYSPCNYQRNLLMKFINQEYLILLENLLL